MKLNTVIFVLIERKIVYSTLCNCIHIVIFMFSVLKCYHKTRLFPEKFARLSFSICQQNFLVLYRESIQYSIYTSFLISICDAMLTKPLEVRRNLFPTYNLLKTISLMRYKFYLYSDYGFGFLLCQLQCITIENQIVILYNLIKA